jgi:hypothetical protein
MDTKNVRPREYLRPKDIDHLQCRGHRLLLSAATRKMDGVVGLAVARSDGRYGGRRPSLSDDDVITAKTLLAKSEPMEKLVDRFGVSRATLYNYGLRKHPPSKSKTRTKKR